MTKEFALGLVAVVAVFAYQMLLGFFVADLWNMAFVPLGAPPITAYAAIVALIIISTLYSRASSDPLEKQLYAMLVKALTVLMMWGAAYVIGWVLL